MTLLTRIAATLLLCLTVFSATWAVEPDEILDDPVLEARARELSREIRCLVCQNESIDSSNADLARELRILVRERLVAGDSDQDVLDFLVERYGAFVLLRPPMTPTTYLLWFGPFVFLLLGGIGVAFYLRSQRRTHAAVPDAPLSAEETARLQALLAEGEGAKPPGKTTA